MMKTILTRLALALALTGLILHSAWRAPAQEKNEGDKPRDKKEAAPEASIFPDKNLEAAVRRYVFEKRDTDKPVTEADVANVSTIEAPGKGIKDLTGLEKCRSLALLDLARNAVQDLSPVRDLPRLQSLTLSDNQIEDITPLATVSALQYIELSRNKVENLAPLASLTNLSSLYLTGNRARDISPIVKLPKLSSLYLDENQLKSVAGIHELGRMWTLSLSGNAIKDLAPLVGLHGLYHLFLEDNQIRDLEPLLKMAERDERGEWIPFLNIYLKGNPLGAAARDSQLKRLKDKGARIHR